MFGKKPFCNGTNSTRFKKICSRLGGERHLEKLHYLKLVFDVLLKSNKKSGVRCRTGVYLRFERMQENGLFVSM